MSVTLSSVSVRNRSDTTVIRFQLRNKGSSASVQVLNSLFTTLLRQQNERFWKPLDASCLFYFFARACKEVWTLVKHHACGGTCGLNEPLPMFEAYFSVTAAPRNCIFASYALQPCIFVMHFIPAACEHCLVRCWRCSSLFSVPRALLQRVTKAISVFL